MNSTSVTPTHRTGAISCALFMYETLDETFPRLSLSTLESMIEVELYDIDGSEVTRKGAMVLLQSN